MSCAGSSLPMLTAIAASRPLRAGLKWPAAVWRWFGHTLELRRQRRALRNLGDRQLGDIGITREQALREASKSSWTRI